MENVSTKYRNWQYQNMIASRKSRGIQYENYLGFEGTERALALAQIKVYEAIVNLNSPRWAVKGDRHFRKYFKKFQLKVPHYDFFFIEEYLPAFWDSFRFILLKPENTQALRPNEIGQLKTEFIGLFQKMPDKFRDKNGAESDAVELMLEALKLCLESNNQLLANPIFEIVLLIWYHYVHPLV